MGHPLWPIYDLRLRTDRLELRLPNEDEDTGRYRMTRQAWLARPRPAISIEGLDGCLDLFVAAGEGTR
jgi:hypothetical protein